MNTRSAPDPSLLAAVGLANPARLVTQKEAAAYLGVSVSYLRASSCPKVLLPGTGPRGKPMVRYRVRDLDQWADAHRLGPQ